MSLKLITAPASEPITLAEAKAHLRVTHSAEDTLIESLIKEARDFCEAETGRALMAQTWEKTYDNFPAALELAKLPVSSVTTLKYTDENGAEQTLSSASYVLDNASDDRSAWVVPAEGYSWPATYTGINGVRVRFIAGYADTDSVPAALKQWIKLQIGSWYNNREAVTPGQMSRLPYIDSLLNAYRVWNM